MRINPTRTAAFLLLCATVSALAENDLTITTGTNTNVTAGPAFTTTDDNALLTPGSIMALWSGANVSVATGAGGANSQPGTITIEQAITTTTAFNLLMQATSDLFVNAGGISSGGTGGITLEAGGLLIVTPNLTTVGGAISLTAGLDLNVDGNVTTESDTASGSITLTSTSGEVVALQTISAGAVTSDGSAGSVTITALHQIYASDITAASENGDGGAVQLQSSFGGIEINGGSIVVSSGGVGNAGSILLEANADVLANGIFNASSMSGNGGAITITAGINSFFGIAMNAEIHTTGFSQGGDITLTALAGGVEAVYQAYTDSYFGNAGNVTITAPGQITTGLISATSQSGLGGAVLLQSSAGGIHIQGNGSFIDVRSSSSNAGSIELDAAGDVLVDDDLYADAPAGHGGAVTITAGGASGIILNGMIDTSGGIQGGDIMLTATTGTVWTGATITAGWMSTSGTAGNVTITAQGQITTGTITAGSMNGDGGVVLLQSLGGGIQIGGGDYIGVSSGSGVNAGSIELNAAEDVLLDGNLHADAPAGYGGAVTITAHGTPGITSNGMIDTSGGIQGGDITLEAPTVFVANMTTTVSAIQILSQTVMLGQVQADGTFHIAPQIGETSTAVELNGAILGGVELDFDLGSTGSLLVASGATLGGSGTIEGTTTILGTLAPGSSPGTLTFTGDVDLTSAESFVFELGIPASDLVVLTLGTLSIDSLGLDDFIFSDAGGFAPGDYVLFDTSLPIVGSLDLSQITGTVLGYAAELKLTDGGQDVTLTVTPEPTSALLLAGGGALLFGRRRRRV